MKMTLLAGIILVTPYLAPSAMAQIQPEGSGRSSPDAPDANQKAEGDYKPNEQGQPKKVEGSARNAALSKSPTPFENQTRKGIDPSANGK